MKTLPLSEVLKLATTDKLVVVIDDPDSEMPLTLQDNYGVIARIAPCGPPDDKDRTNAALLAHRWNTHDELIEAVDDLLAYIGPQGPCPSGCNCTLCSAQAVLAKARTVEMP